MTASAAARYGAFKSWTDASGRITISATYDSNGNPTALTRTDGSGKYERFYLEYSTVTNGDSGSVTLVSKASHQQATSGSGPWTTVRSAEYTYYTGTVGNDTDKHGRLGDLKTVVIKDHQRNSNGEVVEQKYYRYVKQYATYDDAAAAYNYTGMGPADDPATSGGTDTDFSIQTDDVYVTSGLKSVFEGPAFARLAANRGAVSSFQDDADIDVNLYASNVFTYQRIDFGDTGYPLGMNNGTMYRVTEETVGEGCSICSGGFGTYKYEYNFINLSWSTYYNPITHDPTTATLQLIEYFPDTTLGDWTVMIRE
jgi:hypothetical protein